MSQSSTPVPWVVVPTFNEAGTLEALVASATRALGARDHRILVVDDDSPDGTGRLADRLAAADGSQVEVLHRTERAGLGPAYLAGFEHALERGASHVLEMDADLSHDPADLPRLIEATEQGCDLALGSRYVPGGAVADWGVGRRILSRGGSFYARVVLDLDIRDLTGGYKCFRREVLEQIDLPTVAAHGYAFQVELTYRAVRAGFRVCEVPITFRDREHGESKMDWRIAAEAIRLVPQLRWKARRP